MAALLVMNTGLLVVVKEQREVAYLEAVVVTKGTVTVGSPEVVVEVAVALDLLGQADHIELMG